MPAATLLHSLKDMGLSLQADGEKLNVQPKTAITDELRTVIRTHKPELLSALVADDAGDVVDVNGSAVQRIIRLAS